MKKIFCLVLSFLLAVSGGAAFADDYISAERAAKVYEDILKMTAKYVVPESSKDGVAILVYVPEESDTVIDAETGEKYTLTEKQSESFEKQKPISIRYDAVAEVRAADPNAQTSFTEQEIKQTEFGGEVMSAAELAEAAEAIISAAENGLALGNCVYNANIPESGYECFAVLTYVGADNQRSVSLSFDAETGKLINLSGKMSDPSAQPAVSKDKAFDTAKEFAQKYAPDEYAYCESGDKVKEGARETDPMFSFQRAHGGYEIMSLYNRVDVSVDSATGRVCYYNLSWDDGLDFESPKGIISDEKAARILLNACPPTELKIDDGEKIKAVYALDPDKPCAVAAKSGDILNPDGTVYAAVEAPGLFERLIEFFKSFFN